ncbi:MAG: 3-dehydroquinate synthase [Paludibacteraceae bacterium]|nr:3-dehydroquinate synthase [Paludibacteraceae bacterium]
MSLEALHKYENGQICVLADKYLIRHPQWLALDALHELPVLWLETNEKNKSLETITQIWDFLFANGITRRGLLICVGGGVLTDIGGFAAATYKRGIDYINIPTTLLAMVDASSGGKTGINYQGLKNSIGVFSDPIQTLLYPEWLTTLPTQQVLSGYGEMLKTGLLNENLWPKLLQYDLDHMDIQALTPLIQQCLDTKRTIVVADPKEEGWRKVLNLGHTFWHALEEIQMVNGQSSNGEWLHGYAVVYGLIAELYLSVTKLGCPREPLQQLTQVMLQYYGKPQCKCSDRDKLIALMQQDKKNERTAQINCTLLRAIGSPAINQIISINEANEAFDYLFSL